MCVTHGNATPESVWRPWIDAADISSRPLSDWVPPHARLVVVAPHPDDEVRACGALLAMHAQRGGESLIVAVTDGASHRRGAPPWNASRLAAARRAEHVEGLKCLGVERVEVVRLDLPDGQVADHLDPLEFQLKSLLNAGDVLVSTWRGDGHPDHDATGTAAQRAALKAGCRFVEAPVRMWQWATPGDPQVPWDRLRGLAVEPQASQRKQAALAALPGEALRQTGTRTHEYFFV